jgi:MoxR-like ATPase
MEPRAASSNVYAAWIFGQGQIEMEKHYTGLNADFYFAPTQVVDLVNLAIELGRPLLVEGEPGCGKTKLAYAIASELGMGDPVRISIKSTTRARDLLYRFDAVRRLQDAQGIDRTRAQSVYPYISLGPLGGAIDGSQPRRVVLLDEIDKADIDFPNDVLDVLDDYSFTVDDLPEAEVDPCQKEWGFARHVRSAPRLPPIIIITSNREKRLPEPFLRRCIFVQLRFPESESELRDIVSKNIKPLPPENDALLSAAVSAFCQVRKRSLGLAVLKPPATSELIDWVRALTWSKASVADLAGERPPWWRILFKIQQDIEAYETSSPVEGAGKER